MTKDKSTRASGTRRISRLNSLPSVILTRHFFERLFRNEIIDFEDQMKGRLVAVLSILAATTAWISMNILFKYVFTPDTNLSWQEKNYILTLMMMIFGIVTLLEWETLFLDRQDFQNLSSLPIGIRTIFASKIASFIAFVGLFSLAMAGLSSFLFSIYLGHWRSPNGFFPIRYVFAHVTSSFAACLFVFFICVFVRFTLMAVLPVTLYRRVSVGFRFILITFFAFLFFAFLIDPSVLGGSFRSIARLKDVGDPFVFYFPPLWFTGLYEAMLGNQDVVFHILARRAGIALVISSTAFFLAGGFSYYRYTRRSLEVTKSHPAKYRIKERISEVYRSALFRHPEEKAIAVFFSKTIRSSPKHRMTLVNFVAVATAFDLLLLAINQKSLSALTSDNLILLSQPIFLSLILLVGIRAVVSIPVAPEARWIFQVTETVHRNRYVSGLKKAVFLQWHLPFAVLILIFHSLLWHDARSAFNHALFILLVSGLGIEAAFYRFQKIPFACPTVPGKLRIESRGIPYLLALLVLLASLTFIERELLRNPHLFVYIFIISAVAAAALRIGNRRFLQTHPFLFDEKPEPILISLQKEP